MEDNKLYQWLDILYNINSILVIIIFFITFLNFLGVISLPNNILKQIVMINIVYLAYNYFVRKRKKGE